MLLRILLFLCCFIIQSSGIQYTTYLGKWEISGGSVIEIYQKDNAFFGKINKRAKHPITNLNGLDNHNPNQHFRTRQLIGIDILENLEYSDGALQDGTIYNADSGKTYTVKVWIDEENTDLCYIRAYKGILFKTFEAIRVLEKE